MQSSNKNDCPAAWLKLTQIPLMETYHKCMKMCIKDLILADANGNELKQDLYFGTLLGLLEHKKQLEVFYDKSLKRAREEEREEREERENRE